MGAVFGWWIRIVRGSEVATSWSVIVEVPVVGGSTRRRGLRDRLAGGRPLLFRPDDDFHRHGHPVQHGTGRPQIHAFSGGVVSGHRHVHAQSRRGFRRFPFLRSRLNVAPSREIASSKDILGWGRPQPLVHRGVEVVHAPRLGRPEGLLELAGEGGRLSATVGLVAIETVPRRFFNSRRIQSGLTEDRPAIPARESMPSTRATTTRSRKSIKRAAILPALSHRRIEAKQAILKEGALPLLGRLAQPEGSTPGITRRGSPAASRRTSGGSAAGYPGRP